ncbi:MAG TPA: helix-turn-helix domain-containing protein [Jiangellaceae bacterium]
MGLADRVAALEERVRRLEEQEVVAPQPTGQDVFWALDGLKSRAPDGGVLFTGIVTLPTGETYEWQYGEPAQALLDADWDELAADLTPQITALAHPVRLVLLGQVLGGARTVSDLQQNPALGTSGQLYHHLRQLVSAGWLRSIGRGRYAVTPERIIPLLVILSAARR